MDTTTTASSVIASDRVEGTKVYNPAGEKLGSVETLMIDKISGQVRYAVLEFGGFLGMGTENYPLPWDSMTYEPNLGGYVVSLTKEQLEGAPRYERTAVPEYDEAYGRQVSGYYGVPYI